MLEGIRICREGYPSRLSHSEFIERYSLLMKNKEQSKGASEKEKCTLICQDAQVRKERYAVGKTKLFCKVGVISELETKRNNYISSFIILIQANIRYLNIQKDLIERRKKLEAVVTIQDNVRQFAELSQWPWYRIYHLTRGLIPRNRDKERIEELENEKLKLEEEIQEMEIKNEEALKENLKLSMVSSKGCLTTI